MIWLVSLIVLLLPTYLIRFSVYDVPTTGLEILIYASVIAILASRPLATIFDNLKLLSRRFGGAILCLAVGVIVGIFSTEDDRQALGLTKAYFLDPILFLLVLTTTLNTKEKLNRALWSLLIGGAFVGLSALIIPVTADGRAIGLYSLDPTASPNFLALFLAPILPLATYQLIVAKSLKIRLLASLVTLLIGYGLVSAGSRGGLMAAGFGLGLLIFWLAEQHKSVTLRQAGRLGLLVLVVGALIGGFLQAKPDFSVRPAHRVATSNNLRYEIWKTTIVDILPKHWLSGSGLGNYQQKFTELTKHRINYPEYIAPWALTPHNLILTFWVNLGIVGLIGLIWLLVIFFRLNPSPTKTPSLVLALHVSMITLLVHGLVDSPYWKNDLALLFWILIGFQYSLSQLAKDSHG